MSILDTISDWLDSFFGEPTKGVENIDGHVTVPVQLPPTPAPVILNGISKPAVDMSKQITPGPTTPVSTGTWPLQKQLDSIRLNEGGFADNPKDPGGVTMYGISLRFAQTQPDFFDLNHDGKVDRADILAITPAIANQAYLKFFFFPAELDKIPNTSNIQVQLFDLAVNTGVRLRDHKAECSMVLQHALNIPVDGVIGPSTLAALNAAIQKSGAIAVNNSIVNARCQFYDKVVAAHPTDSEFVAGWKLRARKYEIKI